MQFDAEIICNDKLQGDYRIVTFNAPEICKLTQPGQFVHVQIANLRDKILRRPFSICNVEESGVLTIAYKVVGEGTAALAELNPGAVCNLMGPLGKGFSIPAENELPVIIGGGYGSAATYLLARRSARKGVLLLGARSEDDLILTDKFEETGFTVKLATENGSRGCQGLVTDLLDDYFDHNSSENVRFYACGPHGMLMAVGRKLLEKQVDGELSLDHLMCCGVGACFACVVKVKADNEQGWRFARTCKEGPVFDASEVYYGS